MKQIANSVFTTRYCRIQIPNLSFKKKEKGSRSNFRKMTNQSINKNALNGYLVGTSTVRWYIFFYTGTSLTYCIAYFMLGRIRIRAENSGSGQKELNLIRNLADTHSTVYLASVSSSATCFLTVYFMNILKNPNRPWRQVECDICHKLCGSRKGLQTHRYRYHRE